MDKQLTGFPSVPVAGSTIGMRELVGHRREAGASGTLFAAASRSSSAISARRGCVCAWRVFTVAALLVTVGGR